MKSKLNSIVALFLLLPIISYGQSNSTAKSFNVKELLSVLDSLPADKINMCMHEHGFIFEKKGNVYSPNVNGPVKDAYCLRYLRNKEVFIVNFYADKKYLINYFVGSDQDFNDLINEIAPAKFILTNQQGNMNFTI